MRKTLMVSVLAWCGGFCFAGLSAHAYTQMNAWQAQGESFQLGYVIGYLDAVTLAKRNDPRSHIPAGGRGKYEQWRRKVNEFYENPANAGRPVPDAMLAVGREVQEQIMDAYKERRRQARRPAEAAATPSPGMRAPEAAEGSGAATPE